MKKKSVSRSREFELAVHTFAKSLDPTAEVLFDHHVPDRDTGTLRQCDVWINARLGNHWPLSILVACKHHKRKLDIGDIGTFLSEIRETGASTGVIYSSTGFTKPALTKAAANGISCCKLYRNEPADLPQSIWLDSYLCKPIVALEIVSSIDQFSFKIWKDLFNSVVNNGTDSDTLLEHLAKLYMESEQISRNEGYKNSSFPVDWINEIKFSIGDSAQIIDLRMTGRWKHYRGKTEANLLNGSYCFSNETFSGQQFGPAIDTRGTSPGDAWTEISDRKFVLPKNRVVVILSGNVKQALLKGIGPRPLTTTFQ